MEGVASAFARQKSRVQWRGYSFYLFLYQICLALRGDIHFEHIIFKKVLTTEASSWLTRMITKDEVANTVKKADPDKAPGPDGFSAGFFQKCFSIVHEDVWLAIRNFFRSGKMMKVPNASFDFNHS